MKTAYRITTVVLAATALSGCQSISNFFSFKQTRAEQPVATAAVFGSEELEKGRAALSAGYPARAIELFRLAALNEEVAADAFNGMAVAYARLGRADLAERYFKTAMTIDSSNPRYAANLANFYDSPLGQSQRALAMRDAESARMLAQAEQAALSEGLLDAPAPSQRMGAITLETARPLAVTRKANRELAVATNASVAESGDNLASVSTRERSANRNQSLVSSAVEAATADAVSKKRNPTVISLVGAGNHQASAPARISLSKPGSQGVTRPRARSYPVRVELTKTPNR
ncbi:tetratricopeptide repeat protein [Altererythrobacter sp. GH1-8]|uniref:tetratricopeptide repeat protein n=1 Tax=Altererythrobacter sp. GH1-8 TaxID=3349333 RepID=UPI00374D5897